MADRRLDCADPAFGAGRWPVHVRAHRAQQCARRGADLARDRRSRVRPPARAARRPTRAGGARAGGRLRVSRGPAVVRSRHRGVGAGESRLAHRCQPDAARRARRPADRCPSARPRGGARGPGRAHCRCPRARQCDRIPIRGSDALPARRRAGDGARPGGLGGGRFCGRRGLRPRPQAPDRARRQPAASACRRVGTARRQHLAERTAGCAAGARGCGFDADRRCRAPGPAPRRRCECRRGGPGRAAALARACARALGAPLSRVGGPVGGRHPGDAACQCVDGTDHRGTRDAPGRVRAAGRGGRLCRPAAGAAPM